MKLRTPAALVDHARRALRRGSARRVISATADTWPACRPIDVDRLGEDAHLLIGEFAAGLPLASPRIRRLGAALQESGSIDRLVRRLRGSDPQSQARALQVIGALRLEGAVPWMTPLLDSPERSVRNAAARAMGRIGGVNSAEALLLSIQRRGASRMLISELARSAPDHFLESELKRPRHPSVRWAAAAAAGLRGRQPAVGPLIELLRAGNRRERRVSCRALGWIGSTSAMQAVAVALHDREPKVRASAEKALNTRQARFTGAGHAVSRLVRSE
jgi:HEAT repeat protein